MVLNPLSRESGFTLVEAVAVLLIASVLVGLAVPGFTAFVRSNRAEVQSSSIINAINYARAEAVQRSVNVHITPTNVEWQKGWHVWADTKADNAYKKGEDVELQVYPAFTGEATLKSTSADLAFDRYGNAAGLAIGATVAFEYRLGDAYCSLERDISVNHLGRATMTHRSCK